ncbi:hypothetical protein B0H10DRAFT_1960920 [Mycena sp. CBHHK59/15]|nr:hypothetical protein B0H10DRAFT_1960920 [Mycena sp. CBHHK59/15]
MPLESVFYLLLVPTLSAFCFGAHIIREQKRNVPLCTIVRCCGCILRRKQNWHGGKFIHSSTKQYKNLKSLSNLTGPAHSSISIVTQPSVTLEILSQANELGVFSVWLQPGVEDGTVLDFISNSTNRGTYIHSVSPLKRQDTNTSPCHDSTIDPRFPDLISTLLQ